MAELTAQSTPWGDPGWREQALTWANKSVAEHGATVLDVAEPRFRPWSVTMRLRTDRGPVWFKANPPGSRFEPALAEALSEWVPGQVLTPWAVDAAHGWSLLPDGGPILAQVLDARPDLSMWEDVVRQYALLQRALVPHVAGLLTIGVPDLRATRLPARFAEIAASAPVRRQVGARDGISPEQYARLCAAEPLREWCERLAASPVPPTLDHSDLHDAQVFAADDGRFVFFDWGDAAIGHPFTSLLVVLRSAANRFGPEADLGRLREAYLEPWTAEHPVADLRADLELAIRLGGIARAASWWSVFPEAAHVLDGDHGRWAALWLLHVLVAKDVVRSP